jgi:alkanesulfonate monooxygenase SsuD/methylene tetrahydromethanopterin reductase-like flavin-dependent oxidoreductase (luciferase family)
MHFALGLPVQHPQGNSVQYFAELLTMVRTARTCGFDYLRAPQHYLSTPFQYFQPIPTLARVAAESGDMILATSIILLTLHNPVDMAEQIATLDIICQGKLVFGVGLGYRDIEYEAFGINPKTRVSRFVEALELIKKLWTEERVSFAGKHFRLSEIAVATKPVQKPRPPIWLAANSDAAVKRAAQLGDTWIINPHAHLSTLERQVQLYREALVEAGKPFPEIFPMSKELYIAKDRETAWKEARPYLEHKYKVYVVWGQDKALPHSDTLNLPFEELVQDRFIIGDPDDCIEQISNYQEKLGVTLMGFRVHWPGMELTKAVKAIELLGEKVLPYFRQKTPSNRAHS